MTKHEREILPRQLTKTIVTMCRETLTSPVQFVVDGLLCIRLQDSSPIIINVHEVVKANQHSITGGIHQDGFGGAEANSLLAQQLISLKHPFSSHALDSQSPEGVYSDAKRRHGSSPGELSSSSPFMEGDGPEGMSSDEDARSFRLTPPSDTSQSRQLLDADLPEDLSKATPRAEQSRSLDFGMRSPSSSDGRSSMNEGVFAVKRETPLPSTDVDMEASSSKGSPTDSGNFEEGGNPNTPSRLSNNSPDIPSHLRGEGGTVKCLKCQQTLDDTEALVAHNLRDHALFTCHICFRGFTARNNLKRHIRLHTGVKPFKCPMCNHAFSRKDDLKGHVLRHSYSKPFRCSLCTKGYTDRSCVRNHMAKEHGVRLQHVCPQCGEGFSDSRLYTEHKKLHPEFRSFRCKHCSFIGINGLMHMKHLLIHQDRTFACSPCGETFSDPFDYSEHLKQHRGDEEFKSYACCFCSSILPSHEQFMRHEYTHAQGKTHMCNICQKVFRFPSSLKEHMEMHRPRSTVVNNSISNNNNSDSQCNLEERFGIHLGNNYKERISPQPTASVSHTAAENMGTQYYCTECQVGFESEDVLQEHIVQAHEMPQAHHDGSVEAEDDSMTPQDLSLSHKSSRDESRTPSLPQPSLLASTHRSLLNGDSILKRTLQGASLVNSLTSSDPATIDLSQTKSLLLARKRQMSASPNGLGQVDLSQTKVQLLSSLERKNEAIRRLQEAPERQQVQTAIFSIHGDALRIKKEAVSDDEGEGDSPFGFSHLGRDVIPMRPLMNGLAGHDRNKESPDGSKSDAGDNIGADRPGDVSIERMHIRAPGFERVVTPDVLFRDRTSLTCQQCSAVFTNFASFEAHSSEEHRRFVCEFCGKSFTAKPNRDRHVRYHTGVRPYQCPICDQRFFRGDDLKYHRTTRHANIVS